MSKYNYILLAFKRGDQIISRSQEHLAFKNNMPVMYIDPNDWGFEPELSEWSRKAFGWLKLPNTYKSLLDNEILIPNQDIKKIINKTTFSQRSKILNIDNIVSHLRENTYKIDLESSNLTSIKDVTSIATEDLFRTITSTEKTVLDVMSISTGSFTIGTGKNYLTIASAFADLTNLTGDLNLIQEGNIVETSTAGITVDLNGHTLKLFSNKPHNGVPIKGWKIYLNISGNSNALYFSPNGPGTLEVFDLNVIAYSRPGGYADLGTWAAAPTVVSSILFHDIIHNGNSVGSIGLSIQNPVPLYHIYNFLCINPGYGMFHTFINTSSIIENCLITGSTANHNYDFRSANLGLTVRNCIGLNPPVTADDFGGHATINGYNNVSSDTSAADDNWLYGENNQTSINSANEFISTSSLAYEYMKLKYGGVCAAGGAQVAIPTNLYGIRKNSRPGDSYYSIGPDEHISPLKIMGNIITAI